VQIFRNDFESNFKVYPVPAGEVLMLESSFAEEGTFTSKNTGCHRPGAGNRYMGPKAAQPLIRLDKLNSGLHILQVVSEDADGLFIRRFIKQ
jgi:hypothetical protein